MIDTRHGSIMTGDKKTYGYYVVKWDGPTDKFQEDTDGF